MIAFQETPFVAYRRALGIKAGEPLPDLLLRLHNDSIQLRQELHVQSPGNVDLIATLLTYKALTGHFDEPAEHEGQSCTPKETVPACHE